MDHDSGLTFVDLRQRRVSKAERQSPFLAVQDFLLCKLSQLQQDGAMREGRHEEGSWTMT